MAASVRSGTISGPAVGRYILERKIASGGMADVYLARLVGAYGFEKRVALKVLKQSTATDAENVRMFVREAVVAAEFRHPNLAQVYEVGEANGQLFIAMELVRGLSIAALLRMMADRGAGMPLNVALRIGIDALEGLAHAHETTDIDGKTLGLVHRDVSPQNLMVGVDGVVKVVDFGVARAEAAFGKTIAPRIKGKFSYMAPEQWEPTNSLDARVDVFAMGIVLYEMTTGGRRLFAGESPGELYQSVVRDPIPHPRTRLQEYPEPLAKIILRALEKRREDRWPDARAMRSALLSFAQAANWNISTKAVTDMVRDILGGTDIESTWEVVNTAHLAAALRESSDEVDDDPAAKTFSKTVIHLLKPNTNQPTSNTGVRKSVLIAAVFALAATLVTTAIAGYFLGIRSVTTQHR